MKNISQEGKEKREKFAEEKTNNENQNQMGPTRRRAMGPMKVL
jgi:hypothetical protein